MDTTRLSIPVNLLDDSSLQKEPTKRYHYTFWHAERDRLHFSKVSSFQGKNLLQIFVLHLGDFGFGTNLTVPS